MPSQVGFVWSLLLVSGIARADQFSGTISGIATVPIDGNPLAVVGMRVELLNKDGGDPLASVATEEGGVFALAYDYTQSDPDDTIELYLKFVAETEDGMIRVRTSGVGRVTRSETFREGNPIVVDSNDLLATGTVDLGEISLDAEETKPQLLHWANRARLFVDAELGGSSPLPTDASKPLDIMDSPIPGDKGGGFFVPGSHLDEVAAAVLAIAAAGGLTPAPAAVALWVSAEFSDQDCIYLAKPEDTQTKEGNVFHEFGHYFMWHAQEGNWLNPLEASFAEHGDNRNASNPMLAWTEGWADGFGFMVDSWSADDDGEGHDDITDNVDRDGAAGLILCKGGSGCSQQAVTHGFWSEHFIGSALYDLWDGAISLSNSSVALDHDDGGTDAIEMSFAELVDPILGSAGDLVSDIVEYHSRLTDLELAPDGELGGEHGFDRKLTELFTSEDKPNKVRNVSNVASTPAHASGDLLNTDAISVSRAIEVQTFKERADGTLKEANDDTATFTVDVPVLSGPNDIYNVSSTGSGDFEESLLDDLTITGTMGVGAAGLHFNHKGRRGWQAGTNSYDAPAGPLVLGERQFAVTLAGNMDVTLIDQGGILIGQASEGRTADVTLDAGATLTLGGGPGGANPSQEFPGGPLVSKGLLYIDKGSRLVIEREATLFIKRGAEITVDGSELVIRGNLVVEEDATFQWTSLDGGMVTFDLEDLAGEPNVTMKPGSTIRIAEQPFTIAPFTYVRPTPSDHEGPRSITIEQGAIGFFDEEAYLDTTGTILTLLDSTIEAKSAEKHNGVRLDNNQATIEGMTFSGGTTCIDELGSAPDVANTLEIVTSTFGGCTTAIKVDYRSLSLGLVIIDDGETGVAAFAVPDVAIASSDITQQTEHGLDFSQGGGVTIVDSTFWGNRVGIELDDGAGLRLVGATIASNSVGVRATDGAVVNAGYVGSEASNTSFDRNGVGIQLQDAGFPILAGDNGFFEASGAGVRSISGTIDDGGACGGAATIIVDADTWSERVGGPGGGFHPPVSLTLSPYSINSSTGGCSYTLVQ